MNMREDVKDSPEKKARKKTDKTPEEIEERERRKQRKLKKLKEKAKEKSNEGSVPPSPGKPREKTNLKVSEVSLAEPVKSVKHVAESPLDKEDSASPIDEKTLRRTPIPKMTPAPATMEAQEKGSMIEAWERQTKNREKFGKCDASYSDTYEYYKAKTSWNRKAVDIHKNWNFSPRKQFLQRHAGSDIRQDKGIPSVSCPFEEFKYELKSSAMSLRQRYDSWAQDHIEKLLQDPDNRVLKTATQEQISYGNVVARVKYDLGKDWKPGCTQVYSEQELLKVQCPTAAPIIRTTPLIKKETPEGKYQALIENLDCFMSGLKEKAASLPPVEMPTFSKVFDCEKSSPNAQSQVHEKTYREALSPLLQADANSITSDIGTTDIDVCHSSNEKVYQPTFTNRPLDVHLDFQKSNIDLSQNHSDRSRRNSEEFQQETRYERNDTDSNYFHLEHSSRAESCISVDESIDDAWKQEIPEAPKKLDSLSILNYLNGKREYHPSNSHDRIVSQERSSSSHGEPGLQSEIVLHDIPYIAIDNLPTNINLIPDEGIKNIDDVAPLSSDGSFPGVLNGRMYDTPRTDRIKSLEDEVRMLTSIVGKQVKMVGMLQQVIQGKFD